MSILAESQVTTRAAVYERVSRFDSKRDTDRREARSIERQNRQNAEACDRFGWSATRFTADAGLSASRFAGRNGGSNREDYRRMLAAIRAGEFDVLVLHEASRASRELENWAGLLNLCRATGTRVYVTSHGREYDLSNGRDYRSLAEDGIDSTYESEKLSMRIRTGKALAKEDGRPQGHPPYGLRSVYNARTGAYTGQEPDPATTPVVAGILTRAAAGEAWSVIARDLTGRGIPSPSGGTWSAETVKAIAGRAVYAEFGIVTVAASLAARNRLADAQRKGERPSATVFRYSEVMACAACGSPVRGSVRRGRAVYHCRRGCAYVDAAAADQFIDAVAIERLSRPDALAEFETSDDAGALAADAEAATYRKRITDATTAYASGKITVAVLAAVTLECESKATAAEKRARDLRTPSALAGLAGDDAVMVKLAWDGLGLAARKAATRALMPDLTLARPAGRLPLDAALAERIIPWPAA